MCTIFFSNLAKLGSNLPQNYSDRPLLVIQCSPCYSEVSASLENTLPDCSNNPHFPTLCKINVSCTYQNKVILQAHVLQSWILESWISLCLLSLSSLSSLSYLSLIPPPLSLLLSLMSKLLYVIAGSDLRGGVVELWTASHSSFVFLVCASLSSELAPQLV